MPITPFSDSFKSLSSLILYFFSFLSPSLLLFLSLSLTFLLLSTCQCLSPPYTHTHTHTHREIDVDVDTDVHTDISYSNKCLTKVRLITEHIERGLGVCPNWCHCLKDIQMIGLRLPDFWLYGQIFVCAYRAHSTELLAREVPGHSLFSFLAHVLMFCTA